jgi:hypothetical protein
VRAAVFSLVIALGAGALVGCARPNSAPAASPEATDATDASETTNTTVTSADVATPAPREAAASSPSTASPAEPAEPADAADTAADTAAPALAPLPGQLACRTKTDEGMTAELSLEWSGESAKGVLRTVAPSGMVYEQRVQAQKYKGRIIADDPRSTDLASHAASVVTRDGKRYMRLGGPSERWSACD